MLEAAARGGSMVARLAGGPALPRARPARGGIRGLPAKNCSRQDKKTNLGHKKSLNESNAEIRKDNKTRYNCTTMCFPIFFRAVCEYACEIKYTSRIYKHVP